MVAISILALLTYVALNLRICRGGSLFGRNPLVAQLALLLWMHLVWRGACSGVDWPRDVSGALPIMRVGVLLVRHFTAEASGAR